MDGKEIPEYILSIDYVYLDARYKEDVDLVKKTPLNIFDGIDEQKPVENNNFSDTDAQGYEPSGYELSKEENNQPQIQQNKPKAPELSFEASVLEKFKFTDYTKSKVNLNVQLSLNYDIDKLKTAMQLFNLDIHKVVLYLVGEIEDQVRQQIYSNFEKTLLSKKDFIENPKLMYVEPVVEEKPVERKLEYIDSNIGLKPEKFVEQEVTKASSEVKVVKQIDEKEDKLQKGITDIDEWIKNNLGI
jgi:hypothetical protein